PHPAGRAPWHAPLVAVLTGVVAVAGLGTLVWSAWSGVGPQISQAARPHPAVVDAQAAGPEALRILDLSVEDDAVTYRLVGREPGLWVRDHVAQLVHGEADVSEPARAALGSAVLAVTEGGSATDSGAAHEALLDLGVGYVGLRAAAEDPLVATLDATAELTRVTSTDEQLLWRGGRSGGAHARRPPSRGRRAGGAGAPAGAARGHGPPTQPRSQV